MSADRGRWGAWGLALVLRLFVAAAALPLAAQSVLEPEPPAAPAEPQPPAELAQPAGNLPAVAAIEVRSEAPLDPRTDLKSLLDLEVGAPLTDLAVRRTLRNFQASGLAPEVELYTRPLGSAGASGVSPVEVVVVLRPAVQVDRVEIVGELGLSRESLLNEVVQPSGQPLAEDRVLKSVYQLQDRYAESGYLVAKVRPKVEIDRARRRASVVFEVASGPRSQIGTIAFDGALPPFTPEQLAGQLRLKPGDAYRKRAAEEAAERLQTWLVRQSHNLARVEAPRAEVHAEANTVDLTYPVSVGPRLTVEVVGADRDRLRRRGLLPFLGEEGYDEALVLQAVAKIKDSYQQQGYYHVEVTNEEKRTDGELHLTLTIEPGPEYTLTAVEFEGNQAFSDGELAELMTTSPKRLLALGSGRLVQSELDKDVTNVGSYYALQGYTQVAVGSPQVYESGETLRLVVPIDEGPRQRVGNLDFTGLEPALDLAKVRPRLLLTAGGPFHPVLLEESLDVVRAAFEEEGYDEAQVSATPAWNAEHSVVDLTIAALPGPRAVAARVIVRGNQRTEAEVIRRVAGIRRGDPASRTRLLEAQRNLYRLGLFSRVELERTRPGLAATARDVVVRVEEGKPRSLTYGVGYDSEDGARGLLGFKHNNIAGLGYSLLTDLRLSQRDQRARVVFDQPFLGSYPIQLISTLFYLHEDEAEAGVATTRWGVRSEASKLLGRTRYAFAFDRRVVESKLDDGVALNDLERENRPLQIASVVPSAFLDHRDDQVLPSRGWSSLLQTQYAFPAFGASAEFVKLFLQQTQYFHLGRAGVVAASGRLGGIEPLAELGGDDPDLPPDLPNSDIFISERFFLGGSTTHRAYGRDRLGIPNETLFPATPGMDDFRPVGGNGVLLVNLDYRFPLFGPVGGTIFYDLGNVWAGWRDIDLSELKGGVGIGLRYLSPIGPLRVEAGWKLDRERFESASPVVFLSFGNPF